MNLLKLYRDRLSFGILLRLYRKDDAWDVNLHTAVLFLAKKMIIQIISFKLCVHEFNLKRMGTIFELIHNSLYIHVCGSAFIVDLIMNSMQVIELSTACSYSTKW